jgi:hypothetical protein
MEVPADHHVQPRHAPAGAKIAHKRSGSTR